MINQNSTTVKGSHDIAMAEKEELESNLRILDDVMAKWPWKMMINHQ